MAKKANPGLSATLTVHRAAAMSLKGREEIADWLRSCADLVMEHGDQFASRFTARYLYPPASTSANPSTDTPQDTPSQASP